MYIHAGILPVRWRFDCMRYAWHVPRLLQDQDSSTLTHKLETVRCCSNSMAAYQFSIPIRLVRTVQVTMLLCPSPGPCAPNIFSLQKSVRVVIIVSQWMLLILRSYIAASYWGQCLCIIAITYDISLAPWFCWSKSQFEAIYTSLCPAPL